MKISNLKTNLKWEKYIDLKDYAWQEISYNEKLSEDFIRAFANKLDWFFLCQCQHLSEPFIEEFIHKIKGRTWNCLIKHQYLSEKFIEKYWKKFNFFDIVQYQKLPEEFWIKHIKSIIISNQSTRGTWEQLLKQQKLSEQFLRTYTKYFNSNCWHIIFNKQNVSIQFCKDFQTPYKLYANCNLLPNGKLLV